jgi:hypothetical protein
MKLSYVVLLALGMGLGPQASVARAGMLPAGLLPVPPSGALDLGVRKIVPALTGQPGLGLKSTGAPSLFTADPLAYLPRFSRMLKLHSAGVHLYWSPLSYRAWRALFSPAPAAPKSVIRRTFENAV